MKVEAGVRLSTFMLNRKNTYQKTDQPYRAEVIMNKAVNCIFCGKKPEDKTKEHIIPQWLIKKTGDKKRKAFFGMPLLEYDKNGSLTRINMPDINVAKEKGRVFSFDQFTFPACKQCNNDYSKLEADVLDVYNKLSRNESINRDEIDLLLDWIDKVRVGLWLVFHRLDKNIAEIEPNFAISERMGCYDRILMVKRFKNQPEGLNFIGCESYAFAIMPSAFCLRINNIYLMSVSSMFLVSKGLGFPYIDSMKLDKNSDLLNLSLSEGTNNIAPPIINRSVWGDSTCIIQPMFKNSLTKNYTGEIYNNDYIIENSLNYKDGKGSIFIIKNNNDIIKMKDDDELSFPLSKESKDPYHDLLKTHIEILNWQSLLIDDTVNKLDLELLTEDRRKYFNEKYASAKLINNALIKHTQESLYQDLMIFR